MRLIRPQGLTIRFWLQQPPPVWQNAPAQTTSLHKAAGRKRCRGLLGSVMTIEQQDARSAHQRMQRMLGRLVNIDSSCVRRQTDLGRLQCFDWAKRFGPPSLGSDSPMLLIHYVTDVHRVVGEARHALARRDGGFI